MTTKTTAKAAEHQHAAPGPAPQDMQTACEVHTLVQLLYGQLTTQPTWQVPFQGVGPVAGYPTTPVEQPHGFYPYPGWTSGHWPVR